MTKKFYFITICFCFFLLLACETKTDEKTKQLIITAQNEGLIGDKITGFSINPKDSSNWLLPCTDRSYITYNKGVDWEEITPTNENVISYPLFDSTGAVLMYDKETIYRKVFGTQTWKSYPLPDSLRVDLLKTGPSDLVYWLIHKQDPEKHYLSYRLDFSDITAMSENQLDSLKNKQFIYQYNLYNDSSYVLINGGHLLYKEDSNGIAKKRMNGIEKAYIEMLIPDEDSIKKVYAIQKGVYNMETPDQYFLYKSDNFGITWQLTDSALSELQLLRNPTIYEKLSAHQKKIKRDSTEKVFSTYQLQVNDTLLLSRHDGALVLTSQNDTILLTKEISLVESIGKFQWEQYKFTALAQLNAIELKILFTNKNGGIQLVTFPL